MSTAVALKTNPGRPQDVELADIVASIGGGSNPPLIWRSQPLPDTSSLRRDDELLLALLGAL